MKVLKFGGTSVGSAENIQGVKEILMRQDDDVIVVVSAMGGITDKILSAARMAAIGTGYFQAELTEISTCHFEAIEKLFEGARQSEVKEKVQVMIEELERIVHGVSLIGELTPKTLDKVGGFGERLSSLIISEYIPLAQWFDSSKLILTNSDFGKALVNFKQTNQLIRSTFDSFSGIAILPGFISSNEAGEYTTLGRGGSDYTGAILAAALDVSSLEIWTDVNGFMTADPRVISKAYTIKTISYAIDSASSAKAESAIRLEFDREILHDQINKITIEENLAIVAIVGENMKHASGVAGKLFNTIGKNGINIIAIAQGASELNISLS